MDYEHFQMTSMAQARAIRPSQEGCRLLRLPAELRTIIFQLTLHDGLGCIEHIHTYIEGYGRATRELKAVQPPLLRTSRQIRSETLGIFYKALVARFGGPSERPLRGRFEFLMDFLSAIGSKNRKLLSHGVFWFENKDDEQLCEDPHSCGWCLETYQVAEDARVKRWKSLGDVGATVMTEIDIADVDSLPTKAVALRRAWQCPLDGRGWRIIFPRVHLVYAKRVMMNDARTLEQVGTMTYLKEAERANGKGSSRVDSISQSTHIKTACSNHGDRASVTIATLKAVSYLS